MLDPATSLLARELALRGLPEHHARTILRRFARVGQVWDDPSLPGPARRVLQAVVDLARPMAIWDLEAGDRLVAAFGREALAKQRRGETRCRRTG